MSEENLQSELIGLPFDFVCLCSGSFSPPATHGAHEPLESIDRLKYINHLHCTCIYLLIVFLANPRQKPLHTEGLGFPSPGGVISKERCARGRMGSGFGGFLLDVFFCSPPKTPSQAGAEITSHLEKTAIWCRGDVDFRTHHDEVRWSPFAAASGCCLKQQRGQSTSKLGNPRRKQVAIIL